MSSCQSDNIMEETSSVISRLNVQLFILVGEVCLDSILILD